MNKLKRVLASMDSYLGIFSAAAPGLYSLDGRAFRLDETTLSLTGSSGLRGMILRLVQDNKITEKDLGGMKIDPVALEKRELYFRMVLQQMLKNRWFIVRPSARGYEIITETAADEQGIKKAQELVKDLSGYVSVRIGDLTFEGKAADFVKNGFADTQYMMNSSLKKTVASMEAYLK